MKKLAIALLLVAPVFGSSILLPFDTGVLSNGTVASGGLDVHYTDTNPGNTVYVLSSPNSKWLGADGVSAWIGPDISDGSHYSGGMYEVDYLVSFDLTGYNASSVVLTGQLAVDNETSILVNGKSIENASAYEQWTQFTLTGFQPGLNEISFDWTDTSGPGGLRVEFLSAVGTLTAPEPASLFLLGIGISAIGLIARRSRAQ